MKTSPRVLVVEDEEFVRGSLLAILEGEGFDAAAAGSVGDARAVLEANTFDVIVTDLRMPGGDGHDVIAAARSTHPGVPIVVLTGAGTVSDAVNAFKEGASDFLEKPVEPDHFVHVLRRAIEFTSLQTEVQQLRSMVSRSKGHGRLVGGSESMERVRRLVVQVAATDAPVLVTGESGTGKELVAEAIHEASARVHGPLLRVNCAAIADGVFENEFFGQSAGAFAGAVDRPGHFAAAAGGTLVLDEIGTLTLAHQAKLLQVLDRGEFHIVGHSRSVATNVRIIAITNDDLKARLSAGSFREDLFHRLNVFPIATPPLRLHLTDLPELADHLLERLGARNAGLDPSAISVLQCYDWPGNVRELRNVLERGLILNGGTTPSADLLSSMLDSAAPAPTKRGASDLDLRSRKLALERELIREALRRCGGRKREASDLLGIDARNLSYHLKKHRLDDTPDVSP